MFQSLITKLIKSLSPTKPSQGYQTRIEPKLGQILVIHDTLDFGPLATFEELSQLEEFWRIEELPDIQSESIDWHGSEFTFEPICFDVNPASGLPMLNGQIDIAGNVFGTSNHDIALGPDLS